MSVYRHYKGGVYEVVRLAQHSETHEPMVVYQNVETGEVWARPSEMFFGLVETGSGTVKRFQHISGEVLNA